MQQIDNSYMIPDRGLNTNDVNLMPTSYDWNLYQPTNPYTQSGYHKSNDTNWMCSQTSQPTTTITLQTIPYYSQPNEAIHFGSQPVSIEMPLPKFELDQSTYFKIEK